MLDNHQLQIVSIYSPSEHNKFWYTTQKRFIQLHTTISYKYQVYVNGCIDDFFDPIDIINTQPFDTTTQSESENHYRCLKNIQIDTSYQYFMLIDSDCFPILYNWNKKLVDKMDRHGFDQAAIYRPENLDVIAHPSMMFFDRKGFANFKPTLRPFVNLLGIEHTDITCDSRFFPLLRTNRVNVHPICAGIYYDMFYHHGAGSRKPLYRSTDIDNYYDYPYHQSKADLALASLQQDPSGFIQSLTELSNG